jgi:hypothetical protein
MPHHPGGEDPSSRAAVDEHVVFVHVALLDGQVHSGHQVMVVVAGIGVVDGVSKLGSVAGRAPGVRVEDQVSLRGVVLPGEVERDVVHGVGAAVDHELEGVLLRGIEVRGLDEPSVGPEVVDRGPPELLHVAQHHVAEELLIASDQGAELGAVQGEGDDVVGLVKRCPRSCGHATADAGHREHMIVVSELTRVSIK